MDIGRRFCLTICRKAQVWCNLVGRLLTVVHRDSTRLLRWVAAILPRMGSERLPTSGTSRLWIGTITLFRPMEFDCWLTILIAMTSKVGETVCGGITSIMVDQEEASNALDINCFD